MAQLWPLDSPADPRIGGVLFKFPSGKQKTLQWEWPLPVLDTLAVSKHLAARLLDDLMRDNALDDIGRTNWPSMTAAIQRVVKDWSEKLRVSLVAKHSALVLSPGDSPTQ